ncbi:MAG: hypothetical protein HZC25_16835 [Rhodospirillales bacterium]|nr:hypothetical protein [Rhodospirillales bacterium]
MAASINIDLKDLAKLPRALTVSAAILIVNLGAWFFAVPELEGWLDEIKGETKKIEGEISGFRQRLNTIRNERANLAKLEEEYKALLEAGWFQPQDRLEAERRLRALAEAHRLVLPLTFQILAEKYEAVPGNVGIDLVASEIQLTLRAVQDGDVMAFLAELGKGGFPGRVTLDRFALARVKEPSPALLADLRAGKVVELVEGDVRFRWVTLRKTPPKGDGK